MSRGSLLRFVASGSPVIAVAVSEDTRKGHGMEPKDTTTNEGFKGFTNEACPFLPCHKGVRGKFNCLFCYCPLIAYECPGPYKVFTDANGLRRKDCSDCTLPHNGHRGSWNFIQKWLKKPEIWDGHDQTREFRLKAPPVENETEE